jgi:hypothetical protein
MGRNRRHSKIRLDTYDFKEYTPDSGEVVNFNVVNEEYLNLRNYIAFNFIEPLKKKNFKEVQENYFNYEYIEAKLESFNFPKLSGEISLLKEIIAIAKFATNTRFTLDKNYKQMYGSRTGMAQMFMETTRIVLEAKYEVYNAIYDNPMLTKGGTYDKMKLYKLGKILDANPGISIARIRKILNYKS